MLWTFYQRHRVESVLYSCLIVLSPGRRQEWIAVLVFSYTIAQAGFDLKLISMLLPSGVRGVSHSIQPRVDFFT